MGVEFSIDVEHGGGQAVEPRIELRDRWDEHVIVASPRGSLKILTSFTNRPCRILATRSPALANWYFR